MDKIPVTIGIPTYNSSRYIKDCLSSVLNQSYCNVEIIIVDNGSTDDTEKIVFSFKDPRIRFYRNPENIYCYGSYNVIISLAKTELIAIYHSDDMYKPSMVEEQVKFLQDKQNVMAVFTEADIINSEGEFIGEWRIPQELVDSRMLDFRTAFNKFMKYGDFLVCPSGMFVKNVFNEVGLFKEEKFFSTTNDTLWLELLKKYGMERNMIFTANDLEMWLRILQKFPVGILHKKLMYYRVHPGQGSSLYSTSYENFFIVMDYYERYARENNFISEHYWKYYISKKIRWLFSKGQRALSRNEFRQARKDFVCFIMNFRFIYPFTLKDILRFCWALIAVSSGPFIYLLRGIFDFYLGIKVNLRQKKMKFP
ncbi:MAG: glycosyltransferase family 2 protein [bacterium]|nr:glycosyltransferase family 2 protein [bacterium]